MSLLPEMQAKFPDIAPVPMQGGGQAQPWTMPIYGYSAEMELIDWLYSFVRLIRPRLVVETGCHLGLTSYALGKASRENGEEYAVITCDIDPKFCGIAEQRVEGLPVAVCRCSSEGVPVELADLLFLDASYESRIEDLKRIKPGAIAVVHDTRQEPSLREAIDATGWSAIHAETWRGFSIVTKPLDK